nr:integrase, catalytic region, zinc finger, CCHC-type, peptidase aspartic, catalytic [Tanacetum cinerariifolium]
NGTEFKNQVLKEYFDNVGISYQVSSVRTPQQNGVVKQRNRTLVEAARTMLIFSCASLFLWAEAIATACFTQNRSIIHRHFNKTPYELINGRKPDISFLHNGLIGVPGNANHNLNGNGNLVAAHADGNATGHNGIQLQAKEFDPMATATDLDEIKEVNVNCILMANLQQASTSGTKTNKAPVYNSDGSVEVHNYEDCCDNDIFNMFTQEEQYTELLESIPKSHQVPQNDNNVISKVTSVEQSGETVEQHPSNVEETRVLYDSLYHNLAFKVEKVNTVNRKLKETNAELTTELARFKNQENKQIMTLNEEILDLNKQLSKEKLTVSFLFEENKRLKSDFKIHEDELLDKQIHHEKKIKELDNILVKTSQSIQTSHMLSPKPDSFYHTEQKMALGYQNPFYLKQAQKKQQSLYDGKVLLENHDPPVVYDSEETLQLA